MEIKNVEFELNKKNPHCYVFKPKNADNLGINIDERQVHIYPILDPNLIFFLSLAISETT